MEKLDIQTETNNKLLAQQDKQQVDYAVLNFNILGELLTLDYLSYCIVGYGEGSGTACGLEDRATRKQLDLWTTGETACAERLVAMLYSLAEEGSYREGKGFWGDGREKNSLLKFNMAA